MLPMNLCSAGQVMLPYYECLPEEQLEGLQHDRDYDCPKARPFRTRCFCQYSTGEL